MALELSGHLHDSGLQCRNSFAVVIHRYCKTLETQPSDGFAAVRSPPRLQHKIDHWRERDGRSYNPTKLIGSKAGQCSIFMTARRSDQLWQYRSRGRLELECPGNSLAAASVDDTGARAMGDYARHKVSCTVHLRVLSKITSCSKRRFLLTTFDVAIDELGMCYR